MPTAFWFRKVIALERIVMEAKERQAEVTNRVKCLEESEAKLKDEQKCLEAELFKSVKEVKSVLESVN